MYRDAFWIFLNTKTETYKPLLQDREQDYSLQDQNMLVWYRSCTKTSETTSLKRIYKIAYKTSNISLQCWSQVYCEAPIVFIIEVSTSLCWPR